MEHFDVMKFVKENDARVQRHYEKMQELERKEKELNFQQIYRNYPPVMQSDRSLEYIPRKALNQREEESIQYTYELNSKPIQPEKEKAKAKEQDRRIPFGNDNNDEEIAKEYSYTPINPSFYKLNSNSPEVNNSYSSNQRLGYATNFNNDFTGISSLNITNNNLNEGMKTSQSAFAASKLSYNPINIPNEEYKPIENINKTNSNINANANTNFEFKNNIASLDTLPLDSQKRNVNVNGDYTNDANANANIYIKQNMGDHSKGYGKISEEEDNDIDIDNENNRSLEPPKSNREQYKSNQEQEQYQEYYQEEEEKDYNQDNDINDKEHYNQPKNKRVNKNEDLLNLKSASLQNLTNSDGGRIDTKKSKKKTTPRFNSINDENTIEDCEFQLGNSNLNQQPQKQAQGAAQAQAQGQDSQSNRQKQYQGANGKIPYNKPNSQVKHINYSTNNTSSTINTKKKYNGKMDNVSRMQQYNDYWKNKPYTKNPKKKIVEPEATPESRFKMNKLQFVSAPMRYYTKM